MGGAGDGLADGHPVREAGDEGGDDEPYGARVVGAHPHPAEQDEDGDEGKGGDKGGQGERIGDGVQLLHEHTGLPAWAIPGRSHP
ncbi:hypothetical protein GCM10009579_88490 [Streptomyces javensis]|uniref:Uncharacterized protein n=1 Tax=Streptomyces javensis TaxID=114698 RepID=A0ABP4I6A1_9ACTN